MSLSSMCLDQFLYCFKPRPSKFFPYQRCARLLACTALVHQNFDLLNFFQPIIRQQTSRNLMLQFHWLKAVQKVNDCIALVCHSKVRRRKASSDVQIFICEFIIYLLSLGIRSTLPSGILWFETQTLWFEKYFFFQNCFDLL